MKKDELGFGSQYFPAANHYYTPLNNHPDSSYQAQSYGEVHLQGRRSGQEDGGVFVQLADAVSLTPNQVGERLWTAIKIVDQQINTAENLDLNLKQQGTTACIACLHQNHLITANLADSVLFVALYGSEGQVLGVAQVTEQLHKPFEAEEKKRIEGQGGHVFFGRVNGNLAVARALGDHQYNSTGEVISSDAALGIYSIEHLQTVLNPSNTAVGTLKFFITCDGFTDAADEVGKAPHVYLKDLLSTINNGHTANLQESVLADGLAKQAIADGSGDNVSASILTYNSKAANTIFFGIFDGHGGQKAVNLVVNNFTSTFNNQLTLVEETYQQQPLSTGNSQAVFQRDNNAVSKVISPTHVASENLMPAELPVTAAPTVIATSGLEKRQAIESKADTLLIVGEATKVIYKNQHYIANNPEHNKKQDLERVQFVFANAGKQQAFKELIEKSGVAVLYCGSANLNPYVLEMLPESVEAIDIPFQAAEIISVQPITATTTLFTKPDIAAIYNKFGGVRSCIGAVSVMLAKPDSELPNLNEIAFVQLGRDHSGVIRLQLSFRNEKDAFGLMNLLTGQEFKAVGISTASFNHPEFGLFNAVLMIKAEEIPSYIEDLCGLRKTEVAFLYRISNLGGYYCQQQVKPAKWDELKALLISHQKKKAVANSGFFSELWKSLESSHEEQEAAIMAVLTIICQVRANETTPSYESLSSKKPILDLLKEGALGKSLETHWDLVSLLVSSSQCTPTSAPTVTFS